ASIQSASLRLRHVSSEAVSRVASSPNGLRATIPSAQAAESQQGSISFTASWTGKSFHRAKTAFISACLHSAFRGIPRRGCLPPPRCTLWKWPVHFLPQPCECTKNSLKLVAEDRQPELVRPMPASSSCSPCESRRRVVGVRRELKQE